MKGSLSFFLSLSCLRRIQDLRSEPARGNLKPRLCCTTSPPHLAHSLDIVSLTPTYDYFIPLLLSNPLDYQQEHTCRDCHNIPGCVNRRNRIVAGTRINRNTINRRERQTIVKLGDCRAQLRLLHPLVCCQLGYQRLLGLYNRGQFNHPRFHVWILHTRNWVIPKD